MIYPNDHNPPHVHVLGAGYEVVIWLDNCEEIYPSLREMRDKPTAAVLRTALLAVHERCGDLFRAWRLIHGYEKD